MGLFDDINARFSANLQHHGHYLTDPHAAEDEKISESLDILIQFVRPERRDAPSGRKSSRSSAVRPRPKTPQTTHVERFLTGTGESRHIYQPETRRRMRCQWRSVRFGLLPTFGPSPAWLKLRAMAVAQQPLPVASGIFFHFSQLRHAV
jgi:hypothetical protein